MKKFSILIAFCCMAFSCSALDNSPITSQSEQKRPKAGEVVPMVKDALPRLENLQKIVWISKMRIETFQNQKTKAMLLKRGNIILESIQNDIRKAGLNSPGLRQSQDALVYGWQQEGYANALNVTFQLDVDTCKLAIEQSIQKLKAPTSGIKGMMWRGKKPAEQMIMQLQQHCKIANNRKILLENSAKTVENAVQFNEIYNQLNTFLKSK